MASPDHLTKVLSPDCKVTIPEPNQPLHDVVSRWSDAGVSLPYAVVTPSRIEDLPHLIQYAKTHHLKIIPTNGGHASFVPINKSTIYLDMQPNFKAITLDEQKGQVTFGAGCLTGDVLKELAGKGWYTCTPNANAVGITGAVLGGLSHALNGRHGYGVDHVREVGIVPFSRPPSSSSSSSSSRSRENETGEILLSANSQGQEKQLWNVMRGAGHGLGIITHITLAAWRISSLNLDDDKFLTRRLIFPGPAIDAAVELYTSLLSHGSGTLPPQTSIVLVFLRAPPTAPKPGAPTVMLAVSWFGAATAAESYLDEAWQGKESNMKKAVMDVSVRTAFADMNDGVEALNTHGGFKEYHGCFLEGVDGKHVVDAYRAWEAFTTGENMKERGRSYVVFGSWSTEGMGRGVSSAGFRGEKEGKSEVTDFSPPRDRGIFVQCTPWYTSPSTKPAADSFGKGVVEGLRRKDDAEGRRRLCFANNVLGGGGQDMREVYGEEAMREIGRVKGVWDREGCGWSPSVEGW